MKTVAIYSRKSIFSNKGDSISNQIELCKQYLKTTSSSENFNFLIYEDDGFSGSNLNRPMFKQLIQDTKSKKFSILICYRLDRLSRNVADFSNILNLLQKNNIDFISIKEQFDTTTPIGRAMIYISSVFAQLERETIQERISDNLLELSKTGRWLGGLSPFGFKNGKQTFIDTASKEKNYSILIPINKELDLIKIIYSKYLEFHSLNKVKLYLCESKLDTLFKTPITTIKIKRILSSPLYVKSSTETHRYLEKLHANVFGIPNGNGYLSYNKKGHDIKDYIYSVSYHAGIIESDMWLKVQMILKSTSRKSFKRLSTGNTPSLLSGILKCSLCNSTMHIKKGTKIKDTNTYYTYYVCSNKKNCPSSSVRSSYLDELVLSYLNIYDKTYFKLALEKYLSQIIDSDNLKVNTLQKNLQFNEDKLHNLIHSISITSSEELKNLLIQEAEKLSLENLTLKSNLATINKTITISPKENHLNLNEIIDITKIPPIKARFIIQTLLYKATFNRSSNVLTLYIK